MEEEALGSEDPNSGGSTTTTIQPSFTPISTHSNQINMTNNTNTTDNQSIITTTTTAATIIPTNNDNTPTTTTTITGIYIYILLM